MTETTVNIGKTRINRLSCAALRFGISRKTLSTLLLRRIADDYTGQDIPWNRIRYQQGKVDEKWFRLHLTISPAEYEFFLDLRKVCKRSVSFLLSLAIDKYLDEVGYKCKSMTDNYRINSYIFSRIILDGVICWIQCWGIPKNIHTTSSSG